MKRFVAVLILTSTLLSLGCTKSTPTDKTPLGRTKDSSEPNDQTSAEAHLSIQTAALGLPTNVSTANSHATSIVGKSLAGIAEIVLNPARVANPRSLISSVVRSDLATLNAMILAVDPKQRGASDFQAVLQKYKAALTLECGEIKANCLGLHYFAITSNSSPVVKLIAHLSKPTETLQILQFAIELQNEVWDPELGQDLVATLHSPEISGSALASTKGLFESAIQVSADKLTGAEESRKFLQAIQAWKLAGDEKLDLTDSSKEALFAMIARSRFMYTSSGALDPEFISYNNKLQSEPDSFKNQQLVLQSQKLFLPAAVAAEYVTSFDELSFIIDAVFRGKISPSSALGLFSVTGKTSEDLDKAVENFVKIQFVMGLYQSSLMARAIFNYSVPTEELLQHALKESNSVKKVWSELRSRLNPLRSFSVLALAQHSSDSSRLSRMESFFNSFDSSINQSAVYPHTLILFHLLSQKSFKIDSSFYSARLDSADLMTMLFDGKLKPVFEYSESKTALNHFQIIHAFDMAVRTNLFAIAGINVDHFMADTLRRLNENPMRAIDANLTKISQNFAHAKDYPDLKTACAELDPKKAANLPRRSVYLSEMANSPFYGTVMYNAFLEAQSIGDRPGESTGDIRKQDIGLYYLDGNYSEMLEQTRLNLGSNKRLGEAMLASYKSYLSRFVHLNESEIDARTSETRAVLQSIAAVREKVLTQSKKWFDDLGRCFFKAGLKDFQIEDRLLQAEQAYLRKVHRDMVKLRTPGLFPRDRATIEASYRLTGLPSQFAGKDRINENGYMYSRINLFIRLSRYMSSGLKTDTENIDPIAPEVFVDLGKQLNEDVPVVHDSYSQYLPFIESEKEFVDSGMKLLLGGHRGSSEFLNWLSAPTGRVSEWKNYVLSMGGLYRLEWDIKGSSTIVKGPELLAAQESFLDYFKFSSFERETYDTVKLHWKFEPLYLNHIFVVTDTDQADLILNRWGLFDVVLRVINEDELGSAFEPGLGAPTFFHRYGYQDIGRQYYRARSNQIRGASIIPFNTDLDQALDQSVKGFVLTEQASIHAFQQDTQTFLQKIQQLPASDQPRVDLNLVDSISSPLLSESVMKDYRSRLQKFYQETSHCFDPKASVCAEMK
jgi:hypothetical protein